MKYLAIGDIHIDENNRLDDLKTILSQIVRIANEKEVKKILFLGDLFTTRRPTALEYKVAYEWVMDLLQHSLNEVKPREVILLKGNHDIQRDASTLDAFDILQVPHVKVVETGHVEDKIFMGHFILREAVMGPSNFQVEGAVTLEQLFTRFPGHRLYLFGDIHTPQQVNENPPVYYIGSVMRNNFGERSNQPRLLYFEDDGPLESIALKDRHMCQYEGEGTENSIVWSDLPPAATDFNDAIVKVVLRIKESDVSSKYDQIVRDCFKGANSLLIQYDVKRISPVREDSITLDTCDFKALEEYFTDKRKDIPMTESLAALNVGSAIINKVKGVN